MQIIRLWRVVGLAGVHMVLPLRDKEGSNNGSDHDLMLSAAAAAATETAQTVSHKTEPFTTNSAVSTYGAAANATLYVKW